MAYSRVGTPRFFIDFPLFARNYGLITTDADDDKGFFHLNPAKSIAMQLYHQAVDDADGNNYYRDYANIMVNESSWLNSLQYVFILGHRMVADNMSCYIYPAYSGVGTDDFAEYINPIETLNCSVSINEAEHHINPSVDGWSMVRFNQSYAQDMNKITLGFIGSHDGQSFSVGDVSIGWMYEMPHSPDLSLKLSYQNESIKTQITKGGTTLTDQGWSEPPFWLNMPQWMTTKPVIGENTVEPVDNYKGLNPNSRRIWDLSFSYLQDTDLLNEVYQGDTGNYTGIMGGRKSVDGDFDYKGIINSFYAKVYHGTCGFKNPFIFQPNKDVQEFAIVRIDNNSFTIDQVANNVYNCSIRLVETW